MNNIFKNAYFSKVYITRNGRKALYYKGVFDRPRERANYVTLLLEPNEEMFEGFLNYKLDGTAQDGHTHFDIVSEWIEPIVCKCNWKDYYCYHIMLPEEIGHVRVSFFKDEIVISDLFVNENYRRKGYATILLDKVDEILEGRKANITPLEYWTEEWYKRRGYNIINDNE